MLLEPLEYRIVSNTQGKTKGLLRKKKVKHVFVIRGELKDGYMANVLTIVGQGPRAQVLTYNSFTNITTVLELTVREQTLNSV